MKSYHLTEMQTLDLSVKVGIQSATVRGLSKIASTEQLQALVNAALDQVLGEPVAYQTPLRYGSRVSHNKPVKPDDWDDDFITWYCRPLYAPKGQS